MRVGIDLSEPDRLERIASRHGTRLMRRLFGPEDGEPPWANGADALAVAFALKEAALKAMGTGWSQGAAFDDVVVEPSGRGFTVRLRGRAAEIAESLALETVAERVRVEDAAGGTKLAVVVFADRATPSLPRRP